MRIPLSAALMALLLLTACAKVRDSRLNPFNWFQKSAVTTLEPKGGYSTAADTRPLVDQVLSLVVEPVAGGAIVRATGLPPTQGWWSADLVADAEGKPVDGVLTFRFVLAPPPNPAPVSTQQSREITAGVYLSTIDLAEVREITVVGARNARSTRR